MSYPPNPPGQFPPAPAPRRSSMTVPLVVLLIVLALAGAAVAGFVVVRANSGSGEPAAPAQAASAPPVRVALTTVVTPEILGGKAKAKVDTGEPFGNYVKYGITAEMSAAYGDVQGNDSLYIAAAIAVSKGTAKERLEEFKTELAGGEFKVNNYIAIEPGQLGGLAECGDGVFNSEQSGFCVWSDDTTTGFLVATRADRLVLPNTNKFGEFREQIEKPV